MKSKAWKRSLCLDVEPLVLDAETVVGETVASWIFSINVGLRPAQDLFKQGVDEFGASVRFRLVRIVRPHNAPSSDEPLQGGLRDVDFLSHGLSHWDSRVTW